MINMNLREQINRIQEMMGLINEEITQTLKLGSLGDDVNELQKTLGIFEDGKFGKQTEECVKQFQRAEPSIDDDGVVGPITIDKIKKFQEGKVTWIPSEYCKAEKSKNVETQITTISSKENEKTNFGYVVFVSGLVSSMSHDGQTQIFTQNFTKKYPIKSFNYSNVDGITNFIKNNNIIAVILFSKGCEIVSEINLPSEKIYCIEPWNGKKTDAKTAYRYTSIPEGNMYIDYEDFQRGKGTKKGANPTSHKNQHFGALASSAKSISQKI